MTSNSIQYDLFDDAATSAMGEAFDHACVSLRLIGNSVKVREMIAKRIIAAARNGERDPIRLCEQALIPFGIEDMSMLVVSVGRDSPIKVYASVAHAA
jgi:hypothetical protein